MATLRARSWAGYPESVKSRVEDCNRTSAKRILCRFTVTRELDRGGTLTCRFQDDVRLRAGKPVSAIVGAFGACKRTED